jgi:hypothetical protein
MQLIRRIWIALAGAVATSVAPAVEPPASAAQGADADEGRFYAGLGTTAHALEAAGSRVGPGNAPLELPVRGGFKVRGNLVLDVSFGGDARRLNPVPGASGGGLDINGAPDTASVKAVGDLSLEDWLSWRRDARLLGGREVSDAGVAVQMRF